ncbi:MAG: hypothetical protein ACJAYU_000439 [Bradymonadia bacterium]|jgi:uncharacterized protein YaiL (DUF2058 family)
MSLRDALLKAGKIDKKQAQKARTDKRKKRKRDGGHRVEAEQNAQQLASEATRREEQTADNLGRAERARIAREQAEREMRIGNLIQAWQRRSNPKAKRRFHFVRVDGHIGFITVDSEIGAELEFGAAGIVVSPSNPSQAHVLASEGLRKLAEVDPTAVRFYLGPGAPDDPLTCPPPPPRPQEMP